MSPQKWGLSWQIPPRALLAAIADPDRAAAKRAFEAMMQMSKIDIATIEAARRGAAAQRTAGLQTLSTVIHGPAVGRHGWSGGS